MKLNKISLFFLVNMIPSLISGQNCEDFIARKGILGNWMEYSISDNTTEFNLLLNGDSVFHFDSLSEFIMVNADSFPITKAYENDNFICIAMYQENIYVSYYLVLCKKSALQIGNFLVKETCGNNRLDLIYLTNQAVSEVYIVNQNKLSARIENIMGNSSILSVFEEGERYDLNEYGLVGLKLMALHITSLDEYLKVKLSNRYTVLNGEKP